MPTTKRKRLIAECDTLWSLLIRTRDKHKCRVCGSPGGHSHHLYGRRYLSLRHDPRNGVTLCRDCHRDKAHGDPDNFRETVRILIGEDNFEQLSAIAHGGKVAVDLGDIKDKLKLILGKISEVNVT